MYTPAGFVILAGAFLILRRDSFIIYILSLSDYDSAFRDKMNGYVNYPQLYILIRVCIGWINREATGQRQ